MGDFYKGGNLDVKELKIEYLPTDQLTPYENNANIHTDLQVDQIVSSIKEFGFNDPIAIWDDENGNHQIVEGHGRVLAAKKLGIDTLPIVRLNDLSDEQRRAYTHVHNQLTRNSEFDEETLFHEMEELSEFDWESLGFNDGFEEDDFTGIDDTYTGDTNVPQYDITGNVKPIEQLSNVDKHQKLVYEIENSDVSEQEKEFLKLAAARHIVFDYKGIAEYYAQAEKEMQRLMEESALVIIDYDDAISLGYTDLSNKIGDSDCE